MTTANCPSCGAQVEFAIGSSAVVVCRSCRTLVARTDRGVEDDGKVAALIDTGSPLQTGLTGKHRGVGFRLTGRSQLRHQAGGLWDEWYAAFDDGRWGWIAEAQGRFHLTFRTSDADSPRFDSLDVGQRIAQVDDFAVTEIGTATLAAAEGELPWRPHPGDSYAYADLSGSGGRFATIDYSEERPIVFKGNETTLADLGISAAGSGRQAGVAVTKLSCSNCGGPLELRAPDRSERIYCPNCGAGHDIEEGNLKYLGAATKAKRVHIVIPIGTTGTAGGDAYVVAGAMQRSVHFDKNYYWIEYLLFNREKGFRWLVHSDHHWSFVTPIATGDVVDNSTKSESAPIVLWQGRAFKLFQLAAAKVEYVTGEFYWKVARGESAGTLDYIRPPEGLSKEIAGEGKEINWSHAIYMQPEDVESAFGVKVPRPTGVGPLQPPLQSNVGKLWALFMMLVIAAAIMIGATRKERIVFTDVLQPPETVSTDSIAAAGQTHPTRTAFSQPFQLSANQNLEVNARSDVNNTWAYLAGDLLNEETGAIESFELPLEYYAGYEGGEHWSEGSQSARVLISSPAAGRYSMRLEAQWEKLGGPPVGVWVREGVFRSSHLLLALLALTIPMIFFVLRQRFFETQRWRDSDYSPYSSS